MIFNKKITKEKAIEIAKKNCNMPQAIHIKIINNYKKNNKNGILSFISLESPIVEDVTINDIEYFQVTFLKGDISYQQLSDDFKDVDIFYDGEIENDSFAKGLINKKNGKFQYTGTCNIGLNKKYNN